MKRGQVTIYIIVAIIALTAVILTLYVQREYLKSIFQEKEARLRQIPAEIEPVESYASSCLDETAPLSTQIVFLQGGYLEPEDSFSFEDTFDVAYWYDKKDVSPSLDAIEKEIASSIDNAMPSCISEFSSESGEEGYLIEINDVSSEVKINDNNIVASSKVSMNIDYNNITHVSEKTYETSFDSPAKGMYDSAKLIVNSEVSEPDEISLSTIGSLDYDVNFFSYDNVIVYSLVDENLTMTLMFANRF